VKWSDFSSNAKKSAASLTGSQTASNAALLPPTTSLCRLNLAATAYQPTSTLPTPKNESKYFIKKLLVLALNKGINAAKKEYLCNELKCELDQFERDYNTQQDLLKTILNNNYNGESNSGCNTNNNNNSNTNNPLDQSSGQHFKDCFDNYFKAQDNNTSNNNNSNFNNFEIDEIILAPQLEDSSTESEDEDYNPAGLQHKQRNPLDNTELMTSISVNLDTSVKVRQLVSKPQDLLYCPYGGLVDAGSLQASTTITTTQTVLRKEPNLKEISTNTLMTSSEYSGGSQASRRICSRSYTKIPELLQQNSENGNEEKDEGVKKTGTNRMSNLNLSSIPMSKSVIVTASDSSNYKRMTRSTMSRQTSK